MVKFLPVVLLVSQFVLAEESDWDRTRRIAEAQHEIVLLLIRDKAFDKVLDGCKKIFALTFPPEREHLLVQSVSVFTDSLVRQKQLDLARKVVDTALTAVRIKPSKASLYKEKGYILKAEGKDQEALELFQKAIELDESASSELDESASSSSEDSGEPAQQ